LIHAIVFFCIIFVCSFTGFDLALIHLVHFIFFQSTDWIRFAH